MKKQIIPHVIQIKESFQIEGKNRNGDVFLHPYKFATKDEAKAFQGRIIDAGGMIETARWKFVGNFFEGTMSATNFSDHNNGTFSVCLSDCPEFKVKRVIEVRFGEAIFAFEMTKIDDDGEGDIYGWNYQERNGSRKLLVVND